MLDVLISHCIAGLGERIIAEIFQFEFRMDLIREQKGKLFGFKGEIDYLCAACRLNIFGFSNFPKIF